MVTNDNISDKSEASTDSTGFADLYYALVIKKAESLGVPRPTTDQLAVAIDSVLPFYRELDRSGLDTTSLLDSVMEVLAEALDKKADSERFSRPVPTPGLPRAAAREAAAIGRSLRHNEELLGARNARVEGESPEQKMQRLEVVERAYFDLLIEAAEREARDYDWMLKYPLVKIGDFYLAWSDVVDAPTSDLMTIEQVRERGWSERRIAAARNFEEEVNRSGPGESPLTQEAVLEAYVDDASRAAFVLTPEKVQCELTSGREDPVTGEWDNQTQYWSPWSPDEVPAVLPEGWREKF